MSELSESWLEKNRKFSKSAPPRPNKSKMSLATMPLEMVKSEQAFLKEMGPEKQRLQYLPVDFVCIKVGNGGCVGQKSETAYVPSRHTDAAVFSPQHISTYSKRHRALRRQCDMKELCYPSAMLIQSLLLGTLIIVAYFFSVIYPPHNKASLPIAKLIAVALTLLWSVPLGLIVFMYMLHVVEHNPRFPWYLVELGLGALFGCSNFAAAITLSILTDDTMIGVFLNLQICILSFYGKLRGCAVRWSSTIFPSLVIARYYNFRRGVPPQVIHDVSYEYAIQMMNMFKTNRK